jgi:hypothetical protein
LKHAIISIGIAPPARAECVQPWFICSSEYNDFSSPTWRFCRLHCGPRAQRLIQPSKHKSRRTISARRGGVNWKMDKLTRNVRELRRAGAKPPARDLSRR